MLRYLSFAVLFSAATAVADPVLLSESLGERVLSTSADVEISGQIRTHGAAGKVDERPISAAARFRFVERAIEGLGQGPTARRSVRTYSQAAATTNVDGFESTSTLPSALKRIVVEGGSEGTVRFSLDGLLTREAVDLLDMPGDPIALAAVLPPRGVEIDESYDLPNWAAQMLCSLDVVVESKLTARVRSATDQVAYIAVEGSVEGARLGAPTKIDVAGALTFDRTSNYVSMAKISYREKAEIGTISPGVAATTTVTVKRSPSSETVDVAKVPVTAPASALDLYYDAPTWGLRMLHDRDWHLFYAATDASKPVIILRLLENGRLLSQMNLAKIPSARPGEHASLQEFESDIRRSLGSRFGAFIDRTQETRDDGVKLFRVVATGKFDYKQGDETLSRDMQWTYYLIAHPDGRQLSAIFAHEPDLAESLAGRDQELINKLQFFAPQVAAKP